MMQVTIIGVGLIGGSFALALKKHGLSARIVGCDRPQVLERARELGAIDEAVSEPEAAIRGSNLVLLATPVGVILDLIERIGPLLPPKVLLTDTGSTKVEIVNKARAVFGHAVTSRFIPGHPIAGKEHSGIEHADANLFTGASWVLTPIPADADMAQEPSPAPFFKLVESLGARPAFMDAALHDRLCAFISHLPQLLSTALAAAVADEFCDDPDLLQIAGRGLRDMTRLAQSPYSMWRDIALTNSAEIAEALSRMEQHLAHIRENLRTRELEAEFQRAARLNLS